MVFLWFLAGSATEVLNTFIRTWSVERLSLPGPEGAFAWIIVGFLFRLGATALILAFAFRYGAASGAAALLGYWISRWTMIWWINRRLTSSEHVLRQDSVCRGNSPDCPTS